MGRAGAGLGRALGGKDPILMSFPPLFVVGCGRSGTTMLRLMLDSHPDLAIPGESHFITELWKRRRRYRSPAGFDAPRLVADIMRMSHFQRWGMPEALVWEWLEALEKPGFAQSVEAVFRSYADYQGKKRWGDKTPIYVRAIPLLVRLFPNARFLHIIRDGRNVAASYLTLPWGPATIKQAAWRWRRDVSAGRRAGRKLGPGRYLEIRYEALVSHPREVLQSVCRFAGLPFHERMLEFHADARSRIQSRPDRIDLHTSVTQPLRAGIRDWRSELTDGQVLAFEAGAGSLLAALGYPLWHESIPLRRRLGASAWMRALDLRVVGSRLKRAVLSTKRV